MEGWVKIGVQRASVLYPNSCYNEPCYIEVQVYFCHRSSHILFIRNAAGKEKDLFAMEQIPFLKSNILFSKSSQFFFLILIIDVTSEFNSVPVSPSLLTANAKLLGT